MTNTPPGWYPAPQEPGFERQWDGSTWTDERRPAEPAQQGSVAALVLGILSILTAWILVGLVFGIIAAVLGGRTGPKAAVSRTGRVLGIIGIVLTLVFAILRGFAALQS